MIEFLYDYASPYSYLASELLPATFPGAGISYRPTYLRGFDAFAKGVPYTAARLAYLLVDLKRCADEHEIPLGAPAMFPINGLYALRGALAAQRAGCFDDYHPRMFRAAWAEGRPVSTKEAVAALVAEWGLPELALDDPALKDALRASTEDATRRGAFGVPTFFVGTEMFWGHDRMYQVARAAGLGAR